ncbi:exosome complex exonuclease RRP40 [Lentinula aciculospora]|uniref:Ribosomal RNA-processing protein 40 n=1 Tax=Lentinula aciculospora TaxID=153920 RepID=A0A9W9AHX6_9AGAR|nr:exosome complex exonuclease RRP40 [Lentinula aciculospora]
MSIVLPGERAPAQHVNLKLGPGLLQASDTSTSINRSAPSIFATRAGTLNHSANGSKWWIESNARRYVPAAQESVIGVVVQKQGEGFRVDIGSAHSANLDGLAFEGATKRNKPNLKVGSLIYARVSLAHKDMEPELECFDAQTRKAQGFGELKGGFLVRCSLRMCRQLLDPKHFLLPLLGSLFPLEIAVGLNGRVWIDSQDSKRIIAITHAIEATDPDTQGMGEDEIRTLVEDLARKWMFE